MSCQHHGCQFVSIGPPSYGNNREPKVVRYDTGGLDLLEWFYAPLTADPSAGSEIIILTVL